MNEFREEPPRSGAGLSNHVASSVVSMTVLYERYGCDKATTADAR